MYLSELPNVFFQIAKCICLNCQMYFSKLPNVFFQIAKCIFQIANCIWLSSHSTSEAALGFSEKAGNWASFQTKYAANDKSLMLCSWDGIISTAVDKCGWKWIKQMKVDKSEWQWTNIFQHSFYLCEYFHLQNVQNSPGSSAGKIQIFEIHKS